MSLEEKDTSSGRDMRTYRCRHCGRSEDVDYGIALWQALSDAGEADEIQPPGQDARANDEAAREKSWAMPRLARTFWSAIRKRSR